MGKDERQIEHHSRILPTFQSLITINYFVLLNIINSSSARMFIFEFISVIFSNSDSSMESLQLWLLLPNCYLEDIIILLNS